MATTNWIGGTTAVAQITTGTVAATWAADDTITTTLTDEGGGTQSVSTTTTSSTISTGVIDPHIIDLNNSTASLFEVVTWDKLGSTEVRGTADVAGVPFHMDGSVVVANNGTYLSHDDDTANAGPNDVNTAANWTNGSGNAGTVPTGTGDIVRILSHPSDIDVNGQPISYDIKYSLRDVTPANDAPSRGTSMTEFRLTQGYRGIIGNPEKAYYWDFAVSQGAGAKTIIESNSPSIWLKGAHTLVQILRLPQGENALRMTTGTIATINVIGSAVRGKIRIANRITTMTVVDASNNIVLDDESNAITTLNVKGGGLIEIDRGVATAELSNVTIVVTGERPWATKTSNRGATIFYNGTGQINLLHNYSGTFDFRQNSTFGVTVENSEIWSGLIADRSGGAPVTFNNNGPIINGGSVISATAIGTYAI